MAAVGRKVGTICHIFWNNVTPFYSGGKVRLLVSPNAFLSSHGPSTACSNELWNLFENETCPKIQTKLLKELKVHKRASQTEHESFRFVTGRSALLGRGSFKTDVLHPFSLKHSMMYSRLSKFLSQDQKLFSTISSLGAKREEDGYRKNEDLQQRYSGWTVRLANENGYLSWCRNSYLCTVVAIGTLVQTHHLETLHYFTRAAEVLLVLGAGNLIWGTSNYILCLQTTRKLVNMSRPTALLHTAFAIVHMLFWLIAISLYLGIVETEAYIEEQDSMTA